MAKQKKHPTGTIAQNKKARHDYFIEHKFEAGLVLSGWEVKSLRAGKAHLTDSYVLLKDGEAWLFGSHITPLTTAIMPIHCYGTPCDVDAIGAIADAYNLKAGDSPIEAFDERDSAPVTATPVAVPTARAAEPAAVAPPAPGAGAPAPASLTEKRAGPAAQSASVSAPR